MNVRTFALVAIAFAPFAAQADAPSGDFHTLFAAAPAVAAAPSLRELNRNYVEFSIEELTRESARAMLTAGQVRRELVAMPLPVIEA